MGRNIRPQCDYCKNPADVVEKDAFYSCAECWLTLRGKPMESLQAAPEYNDNDDYYIMMSHKWAKEKHHEL